jgi:hypothetical protein
MKMTKKMEKDYITPECRIISMKLDTIMAGSNNNKDWQVRDDEVPGQGAKGNVWDDNSDSDDDNK